MGGQIIAGGAGLQPDILPRACKSGCNPGKPILPGLQPDLLPGKMGLPGSKWVCNLNYRILDLL